MLKWDQEKNELVLVYGPGANTTTNTVLKDCLLVCLVFYVPLKNFSLIWRHHDYGRWWAANFDSCSALMAIAQWRFFNVSHVHVLWHGAFVYNGDLRGLVINTPVAERLAVGLSLHVFTTKVCRGRDSNTQPPNLLHTRRILKLRYRGSRGIFGRVLDLNCSHPPLLLNSRSVCIWFLFSVAQKENYWQFKVTLQND